MGVDRIQRTAAVPEGTVVTSAPEMRREYSFVCRDCTHVWHGVFEFRQSVDAQGAKLVVCFQDGARVPSPLTDSVCPRCSSGLVRVLTPGKVMRPGIEPQ